jgi:catechol 2,3-dioxygenase-like lactoylglutathione lyase family enzyme
MRGRLVLLALCVVAPLAGAQPPPCHGVGAAACFTPDPGTVTTYPAPVAPDQPLRLHHVTLFSANHERLAEWYRDMLGFEIAGRVRAGRPDGVEIEIIRLTMGGLWLNVSRVPNLTERDRRLEYAGWRHLAFGTGDVQRAWESLRARGADVVGQGRMVFDPPGYAVAFVRDPDGNFVEFYQDLRAPAF